MLMAYWDKLIDGIDGKIAKLENELKTITNDIERIERNAKIIALMELKIDLKNGEFGEYENGDQQRAAIAAFYKEFSSPMEMTLPPFIGGFFYAIQTAKAAK